MYMRNESVSRETININLKLGFENVFTKSEIFSTLRSQRILCKKQSRDRYSDDDGGGWIAGYL